MNVNLRKFTLLFTACLFATISMFGEPPSLVNFRGQLNDSNDQPINGSVYIVFRIFSSATGGTELYLENIGNIDVVDGQYGFQFGSNGSPELSGVIKQNSETWMEVTIEGTALPRQRFVSVPYALNAGSAQIASGAVTPDMLSDSILKYLKPEIVEEPSFAGTIRNGTRVELNPGVEGKYVTYQWYKDGEPIDGATSQLFTIESFDVGYHDGNYTVVASNDFGSVESQPIELVEVGSTHVAELNASVSLEMIWVEPGTFTMGSPESEADRATHETQHEVTLTKGFYLGKYEVTQAQYEAVMSGNTETNSSGDVISATPSQFGGNPDRPVERVSWEDIQVFLTRLNSQQAGNIPAGWAYVLPTDAQWEYACRAGTTTVYSWGDSISASDANYNSNIGQTADVGQYSANPWGFFDMHGNVWEWTADAYANYATGAQTDPFNVGTTGSIRVLRGGSWSYTGTFLRSAYRFYHSPSGRNSHFGFRVGFQQQ